MKLDVEVTDGSTHVESLNDRPVRLMPDGRAGVVYGGVVYPLHEGRQIDLRDDALDKERCQEFVEAGTPVPYATKRQRNGTKVRSAGASPDRWYLESNRFGHYLVFDASATVAPRVATLMEESGLGVRRWDASVRESDNGEQYDWFIRLKFEGSREECLRRVRLALGGGSPVATSAEPARSVSADVLLRVELTTLKTQLALQEVESQKEIRQRDTELKQAREQIQRASVEITKLRSAAKKRLSAHQAERQRLHDRVTVLEQAQADAQNLSSAAMNAATRITQVGDETEWLTEHAAHLEDELEAERTKSFATSESAENALDELSALRRDYDRINSELIETKTSARERRTAVARVTGAPPQGSLEGFLKKLMPRLDFDADVVDALLEWPKPWDALELMHRVDARDTVRKVTGVHDKPGWFEVPDIVTGRVGKARMGRIFYFPLKQTERVFMVLHEKRNDSEGDLFISRLPDEP